MNRLANFKNVARLLGLCLAVVIILGQPAISVFADSTNSCDPDMSTLDCQALYGGWQDWVPDDGSGSCGTSDTTTLAGNDNVQKIFNYFIAKGLPAAGTAGIMGNMQAESHFDPSIEQTSGAWEDLSSLNINEGGKGGVGLVQWDGGRRPAVIKYMLSQGLTDADFHKPSDKLLGAELDYVWKELNGPYIDTLHTIQKDTDPAQAAFDFHKGYEGSSDSAAQIKQNRMDPAVAIYKQYSGASSGGSCSSGVTDCTSASGVAKIICAAKAYDTVSYHEYVGNGDDPAGHQGGAAWHTSCPKIGPSCYLDCSGLVNVAVYDAFGVEINENTDSERADIGKYWEKVSVKDLQPGDIMQPNPGHVEIIDHVQGSTLYTFAAHTDNYPQPKQVGPASYPIQSGQLYLHYIGPGV